MPMENNSTETVCNFYDSLDDENSEDGLKIVIESSDIKKRTGKKLKPVSLDLKEKEIIKRVEKEIDETLEEKAARTNLTSTNVKNILKHVVTNEDVLALVRKAENPEEQTQPPTYEPKLTRAKAKELLSSNPVVPLPWPTKKPSSEVHALISDELPEDSSGDEYVPGEDESEDDRDSSVVSESPCCSTPPTPSRNDYRTETNWTEDGIFKIPLSKQKETAEEEANIARRTRSKLCLSETPLEIIEEAFIPPDITTDMYDMDCDDEDWRDFLKKFTRPLDEVTKAAEDEDHDPEYNVLADELDEVDTEELRADRAVKVSKKELNELMAELFEYADSFALNNQIQNTSIDFENEPQYKILEEAADNSKSIEKMALPPKIEASVVENNSKLLNSEEYMRKEQMRLLEQQMRQHVQILTQNFLLTYQHPEYSAMALDFKEKLLNLKYLSCGSKYSAFYASNLDGALELIVDWEQKFLQDTEEVKETKQHIAKVIYESQESKAAGVDYVVTFPPLLMKTIANSDVFLYPSLLPRIPFKSFSLFGKLHTYTVNEEKLVALGLEQFIPYLKKDPYHVTSRGEVRMKHVCHYIVHYMMPVKDVHKLYMHITRSRAIRAEPNPIKYYFQNGRAPVTVHYVVPLKEFGVMPPCKRNKDTLPLQWRKYLYPNEDYLNLPPVPILTVIPTAITNVVKPPFIYKDFTTKGHLKYRRIASKPSPLPNLNVSSATKRRRVRRVNASINEGIKPTYCSTPKLNARFSRNKRLEHSSKTNAPKDIREIIRSELGKLKFNSSIFNELKKKIMKAASGILPSMPNLNSPLKKHTENKNDSVEKEPFSIRNALVSSKNDSSETSGYENRSVSNTEEVVEKDNMDDINALMIASSTIKSKREPSGAEKKRAKLKREQNATLAMFTPESEQVTQQRAENYADGYFHKAKDTLDPEDYQHFLELLNNFDQHKNSVPELYKSMEKILMPKYPMLMNEFLTFLTPLHAKEVGQMYPYLMISNMTFFLSKLEAYFKEQPMQLRKIYKALTELDGTSANMEKVKSTVLPLIKSSNLLTEWFLQIFPDEKPPQSLLNGPFETIDIDEDISNKEEFFETITVPDTEDPYGGPNCICDCHESDDPKYKSRFRHCIPCGLRFIQGRVYIQTGKGLRIANIKFKEKTDRIAHLYVKPEEKSKRKREPSPLKRRSPSKEEACASLDSEDDGDSNKKRACRKRKRSPRKKKSGGKIEQPKQTNLTNKHKATKNNGRKLKAVPKRTKTRPRRSGSKSEKGKPKRQREQQQAQQIIAENVMPSTSQTPIEEWKSNTMSEMAELKLNSDVSAESESDVLEESSQDNTNSESEDTCEDPGSSTASPEHSDNCEDIVWTKREDKIILETLRIVDDKEEAFVHIANALGNRTIMQIKQRFHTLMELLQQMTGCV